MRLTEEKASALFDKDIFKAKIEDTIRTFNVKIADHVQI